ncbi:MAG: anti-sigma factor [Bacteroidota bacterium]
MDIKEYIASGVLEAYLMGELDESDMKAVDRMADDHPEVAVELDQLRGDIVKYAGVSGKAPSNSVLLNVMATIDSEEKQEDSTTPQIQLGERSRESSFSVWSIAASLLLLVSVGFNIYFFGALRESNDRAEQLAQEKTLLADQTERTNQELDYAKLRIAHFLNDDNIHVRMDGLDVAPEAFANVFWNKNTNAVFISVDNLPEPPDGHQYQLWAIKPGIPPVDAGIFDHNQLVQELKIIRGDVNAFAVTLEKEGGSPIATIDKTFVKGFLKKS